MTEDKTMSREFGHPYLNDDQVAELVQDENDEIVERYFAELEAKKAAEKDSENKEEENNGTTM